MPILKLHCKLVSNLPGPQEQAARHTEWLPQALKGQADLTQEMPPLSGRLTSTPSCSAGSSGAQSPWLFKAKPPCTWKHQAWLKAQGHLLPGLLGPSGGLMVAWAAGATAIRQLASGRSPRAPWSEGQEGQPLQLALSREQDSFIQGARARS